MPGLSIKIPGGVGEMVLLILNVPNPYATGNSNPGGNFGIEVNGAVQPAIASFTYNEVQPAQHGAHSDHALRPFAGEQHATFDGHGGVVECSRLDRAHR